MRLELDLRVDNAVRGKMGGVWMRRRDWEMGHSFIEEPANRVRKGHHEGMVREAGKARGKK